jgi:antitoxin component of MazEF toxin-antitoxin module
MLKMKIMTLGNRAAIVLPNEVLAGLKVEKGDWVVLIECAGGLPDKAIRP